MALTAPNSTASALTSGIRRNYVPVSMTTIMPGTKLKHLDVIASKLLRSKRDSPSKTETLEIGSVKEFGGDLPICRALSQKQNLRAAETYTTTKISVDRSNIISDTD